MWKEQRRKKLLATPFPAAWQEILQTRVPIYPRLPAADQLELAKLTQVFLAEKNFEGCGGLVLTDEIKVCISAQACVLLLHRRTDYYPELRSILVYPGTFFSQTTRHLGSGIMEQRNEGRLGEAWELGTVVLAWDAVSTGTITGGFKAGRNVVLHEFAHLLDFEDGSSNGAPPLGGGSLLDGRRRYSSWARVLSAEFEELRAKVANGEEAYLDGYGAKNPAEFFAVATEFFFESPQEMKTHKPELYDELKQFYCQDPAQWPALSGSTY